MRDKRRLNPVEDAQMRRGKKLARMLEDCQAERLRFSRAGLAAMVIANVGNIDLPGTAGSYTRALTVTRTPTMVMGCSFDLHGWR